MSAPARVTVGDLLGGTFAQLRANALPAAAAFLLMAGIGIPIDAGYIADDYLFPVTLMFAVLSVALQYLTTREGLRRCRFGARGVHFGAFFLLCILSGIGILLGTVLLVIPGVILFVRWSLAGPILIGSEKGVTGSLQASWDETRGLFWPILGASLAVYGPLIPLAAATATESLTGMSLVASALTINLVSNACVVAGWYLSLAILLAIVGDRPLAKVFE